LSQWGPICDALPFIPDSNYLGLCPNMSTVGDWLILVRYHPSLVLRKAGGEFYKLVGKVYIYGIMDGKILDRGKLNDRVRRATWLSPRERMTPIRETKINRAKQPTRS
jgi:hypothetical protein